MNFTRAADGRGAFKALQATYRPKNNFTTFGMLRKLSNPARQAGEDVTAFFTRLKNEREQLRLLSGDDSTFPDAQLLESIVHALERDPTFTVACQLIINADSVDLERAHRMLRTAEERSRGSSVSGGGQSGPGGAAAMFSSRGHNSLVPHPCHRGTGGGVCEGSKWKNVFSAAFLLRAARDAGIALLSLSCLQKCRQSQSQLQF
jgi:hypothetical protein